MKLKIISFLLILILVLSLNACKNDKPEEKEQKVATKENFATIEPGTPFKDVVEIYGEPNEVEFRGKTIDHLDGGWTTLFFWNTPDGGHINLGFDFADPIDLIDAEDLRRYAAQEITAQELAMKYYVVDWNPHYDYSEQ